VSTPFDVAESSIADLRLALDSGRVTAAGLLDGYLERIAVYDHAGIRLNSVVVLNPQARADAASTTAACLPGRGVPVSDSRS
jgi:amidase